VERLLIKACSSYSSLSNEFIMFFFLIYAYSFYTLLATAYAGVLPYGCNQGTEGQDLTDALNDVEIVAKGMS
jgi:hypothetical protein